MSLIITKLEVKIFNRFPNVEQALQECRTEGYKPLFMPQLADARIDGLVSWDRWFTTPSIIITGRTKQGSKVVVYAHIPTNLATPEGINSAYTKGLVNGAARFSQRRFDNLVLSDGKTDTQGNRLVWVVDYDKLLKAPSGQIDLTKALKHPQVIPFLGGRKRAERYLEAHAQAYKTQSIGVKYTDDQNVDSPLARLLLLDPNEMSNIRGNTHMMGSGQFFGTRNVAHSEKIITAPKLEDLLRLSTRFVPEVAREQFEAYLRELYQ